MSALTAARFGIKYGYAQGENNWGVGVNYDFALTDALLSAYLLSDTVVTPPASPADGDAYFVPTGATGVWGTHTRTIAAYQGGTWNYYPVAKGLRARIVDRGSFYYWSGTTWQVEFAIPTTGVTSVVGKTGDVQLTVSDVSGAAPLADPIFGVNARGVTQSALDNSTKLATTAYADNAAVARTAGVYSVAGRNGVVTLTSADLTDFGTAAAAAAPVQLVAGRSGNVTLTSSDLSDFTAAAAAAAPVRLVAGRSGNVVLAVGDITGALAASAVGASSGVASLDSTGKVPTAQLPASLLGAVNYQGTWNASANSPSLASGTGTKGFYYKVSVAGTTAIDGISQWNVGDSIIFDGTTWDKLDGLSSEVISVAGRAGAVVLTVADVSGAVASASLGAAGGVATLDGTAKLTAAQLPSGLEVTSNRGVANGYATLDGTARLTVAQLPTTAEITSNKGVANGYAGLDGTGKVPAGQLPSTSYPVTSVAGRGGAVVLTVADVSGAAPLLQPVFTGWIQVPTWTTAARPNAPAAGTVGFASDTGRFEFYNGSAWNQHVRLTDVGAAGGVASLDGSGFVPWTQLRPEVQNLPLAFVIPGKPAAGQVYNLVMATAVTLPANLAGTVVYDGTLATGNSAFTVNKISGGATSTVATVTVTSASHTSATLSTQAAISFAAGDVLQLVAPATQDGTLADIGITLLAAKV